MPRLPDSTKERLRDYYNHIQVKLHKNLDRITSIGHILEHTDNLDNIFFRLYSASETLKVQLCHKQSTLEHKSQILYFALLLNPRPGETGFEERTDTWYFLIQQYRDLKANKLSSASQLITDLDTAINCLRQHILSGDPFPEPHTPLSPGAYFPSQDIDNY
jgi:hypothetical protein